MRITLSGGLQMPIIGLGTYKIRGYDLIYNTLRHALSVGYRSIDTASVYRNEEDIGKALKLLLPQFGLERKDVFITSKLAPKDQGWNRCREACLRSLKNLDTGYIDLYLIHWPGVQKVLPTDPKNGQLRKESWKALEQLQKEGKLKAIGVSNYTKRHLEELLAHCDIKPSVLQIEHHPCLVQKDLVEYCRGNGIHFQAYSSLGTSTANNKLLTNDVVGGIAIKHGKSPAQVLLRWSVQQNIGVLPKSTNSEHIKNNIEIFDFELDLSDVEKLNCLNSGEHYCWNPEKIT